MGMNLSPTLSEEFANLGKDAESTKSAMKRLTSYLKELDSTAIPFFLAKVSETKNVSPSFGEHTISLYEVLARLHGPNILSHLDDIMTTIIRTLTTSGGSFPLQQACSKVVPAIARYGIEPTSPEDKKRRIIHALCKPLSDSLLCSQESLSCGASLCLKALVDCDNWRYASDEMVNEVCLKLTGALKDTPTQTNSHIGLVMSLAEKNSFTVEAYARLLVTAGLHILECGLAEKNSQKRLSAIHMLHSLMKCLDIRSIFSELEVIIVEMEKCQSDPIPYVKGAAFEALETAKKLLTEKGSTVTELDVVSMTGSNFGRSNNSRRRNLSSSGSRSPLSGSRSTSPVSGSPESQTLGSFALYESYMDTPISTYQCSCNVNRSRKNVNRKLWNGNGCGDAPLKGGIFSKLAREEFNSCVSSEPERSNTGSSCACGSLIRGGSRSRTPSPQRTNSLLNVDDFKMYSTPRKLLNSLQDDENSEYSGNRVARNWSHVAKYDKHNFLNQDGLKESSSDSESVSSTKDLTITDNAPHDKLHTHGNQSVKVTGNSRWKIVNLFKLVFLVIFVAFASVFWSSNQERGHILLVPT